MKWQIFYKKHSS